MKKLLLFLLPWLALASPSLARITSIITFPGGSNGDVQINTNGMFDASSAFTYSTTTGRLTISSAAVTFLSFSSAAINGVPYNFPVADGSASQYLQTDGSGNLSWATSSGSGDITAVNAGVGLTGGGTSGDVTLNLSNDSTDYIQVSESLQASSTFYVSSGTVNNFNVGTSITWPDGTVQVSSPSASGGSGTPGGSDTQVQYNDSGSFAGDAGMVYDAANNDLTITTVSATRLVVGADTLGGSTPFSLYGSGNVLRLGYLGTPISSVSIEFVATPSGNDPSAYFAFRPFITGSGDASRAQSFSFADSNNVERVNLVSGGSEYGMYILSTGTIKMFDGDSSEYIGFVASDTITDSYYLKWPEAIGSVDEHLSIKSITSRVADLKWVADGSGSSGGGGYSLEPATVTIQGDKGVTATTMTVTSTFSASNYFEVTAGTTGLRGVDYLWPAADGSASQVLQTDGSGALAWATVSGSGDNLGNHTATQDLDMADFIIKNVSDLVGEKGNPFMIALASYTAGSDYNRIGIGQAGGITFYNELAEDQLSINGNSYMTFNSTGSFNTSLGWNVDNELRVNTGTFTIKEMLRLSYADCSGNANGGALTLNSDGDVVCSDDDSSAGVGGYALEPATVTIQGDKGITATTMTVTSTISASGYFEVTAGTTGFRGVDYLWPSSDGSSGQILATDGSGVLSWETDATAAGGGDDLGSHIATQTLDMAGFFLKDVASMTIVGASAPIIASTWTSLTFQITDTTDNDFVIYESSVVASTMSATYFTGSTMAISQINWADGTVQVSSPSASGGSGTPGGSDTQFQYNNGGSFGGISVATFSDTTNTVYFSSAVEFNNVSSFTITDAAFVVTKPTVSINGIVYYWPGADGSSGQLLSTDGSGALSWATDATGGSGSGYDLEPATVTIQGDKGITATTVTVSTSLEIPNGASPTVDATGEIAFDTTDKTLIMYDGSVAFVVSKATKSFTVTISSDTSWDSEAVPIWSAPTEMAVTIQSVRATVMDGTSLVYNIEERPFASLGSAGTDIMSDKTADTNGDTVTTFTNASIASGAHLVFTTGSSAATGSVTLITIQVNFTLDIQ